MPEQLDLFTAAPKTEAHAQAPADPVKPERTLKPPAVVKQEEPVDARSRELLKEEAKKIARSNASTAAPEDPSPELKVPTPELKAIAPEQKEDVRKEIPEVENAPEQDVRQITPKPIKDPIVIVAVRKEETVKAKSTRGRKSIKEMSLEAGLPEIPEDEILFSKQYYGIGEVALMFKVNTSLLRYWESEFDILKPRKNGKGDRFFRPEDIKNLQVIHHLLRQKKYTIEGAKEHLRNDKRSKEKFEMIRQLEQLKRFLLEMKAGL